MPQDSSPVRISERIRDVVEKMRERYKSSKVFMSMQQSNKERDDYYDAMHEDELSIQEYMMNSIALAANNNVYNLY